MAAVSYMFRRGATYWFRKKLPKDLAKQRAPMHVRDAFPQLVNAETGCFKWELTGSLGTKDLATAKRRYPRRLEEAGAAISAAEKLLKAGPTEPAPPTLPSLEAIEAEQYRSLLADDWTERTAGDAKIGLQTEADRDAIRAASPGQSIHPEAGLGPLGPKRGMSEAHQFAYGILLEEELSGYGAALSKGDVSIVEADARVFFHRLGLRYDPDDDRHYQVALALLHAHVRAGEAKLDRQRGKSVPTPQPAALPYYGPKFSEAFAHWQRGSAAKGGRQIAANTLREARLAARLFTEWVGDKQLGEVTKEDVRSFRSALERKPARLPATLRAMSLKELLEEDLSAYPPSHGNTVNKMLNILNAVVSRAEKEGLTDRVTGFANPFKGVRSDVDERHEEGREPFTSKDLRAIFGTPVFRADERPLGGGGEAAFWLPVLALLTGARQEELAQLRVCDLRKDPETDVWFLDVGTSGGRTMKTASSRRRVPLHPDLERIGLLRYRDDRAEAGQEAPLWPDLKSDVSGKRSAAYSKWFGRYLRKTAGVMEPTKVFHSFRHTFKRLARDADLSEEMHDALTGHAGGGGIGRAYGKGFGLKTLAAGVAKIEAPAAVVGLRWGPKPGPRGNLVGTSAEGTPLPND